MDVFTPDRAYALHVVCENGAHQPPVLVDAAHPDFLVLVDWDGDAPAATDGAATLTVSNVSADNVVTLSDGSKFPNPSIAARGPRLSQAAKDVQADDFGPGADQRLSDILPPPALLKICVTMANPKKDLDVGREYKDVVLAARNAEHWRTSKDNVTVGYEPHVTRRSFA